MFTSAKTVTGKVVGTKHAGTSQMGNPSYDVTLSITKIDGTDTAQPYMVTVRTQSNAGLAYGIENREYRDNDHEYTLSRHGRIVKAAKA